MEEAPQLPPVDKAHALSHAARAKVLLEVIEKLPEAIATASVSLVKAHVVREDVAQIYGSALTSQLEEWLQLAATRELLAAQHHARELPSNGGDQDIRPDEPGGRADGDVHDS